MEDKRKGGITAAELLAKLEKDPVYQARRADRDRELGEIAKARGEEQKPLLADLAAAGVSVRSIWDLVNTAETPANAIPVLVAHLEQPYSSWTRQGIARALTIPDAGREAVDALIRAFRRERDLSTTGPKFAYSNALSVAADDQSVDELVALARDPFEGECRIALLEGLERLLRRGAIPILEELAEDPQVGYRARAALDRLRYEL